MGFFSKLFGGPKENAYDGLRSQVVSIKPGQIADPASPVYGLLMETGHPQAVVTLVALADGTVSLYFNSGGGAIGIGANPGPRKICLEILSLAPRFLTHASPASKFPLPGKGETRFYFMTPEGVKTFLAPEEEHGYNRSPLSPLFHKCHELIAASQEFFGPKE